MVTGNGQLTTAEMIISVQINDQTFAIDAATAAATTAPLDISIPLRFGGEQPNSYNVRKATSKPCKAGDLTGDTRLGGSCNFEEYRFIPHCNGTHTECIGHITNERISVRECLKDAFILARLISVKPENALDTKDTYSIKPDENDFLITKKAIENALKNPQPQIPNPESLIVRTLPNDECKLMRRYSENPPPFFSNNAMEFVARLGIRHLLVDLPSVDRAFDEGKLTNHRIFWNVAEGSFALNEASRRGNTITELIFVPDFIEDGNYLLNLQIAAFETDASPSRPLLFSLHEQTER